MSDRPVHDMDFFADSVISDPYPHYRVLRDLAPAVWLPRSECWAITRFADVQRVLRDSETFSSARGVMLNDPVNASAAGTVMLCMDEPEHGQARQLFAKPLLPAALNLLKAQIQGVADALVDRLVAKGRFDGVTDFAHVLPLTIVSHMVGLPPDGRERMLDWASDIFNMAGPMNARAAASFGGHEESRAYLDALDPARLRPESWGARLFALVADGAITDAQARGMLFDLVAPALDTTINATSSTLWLLATHPDQWAMVREDPARVSGAIDEAMRLETPVRAFSRLVTRDVAFEGITIPQGERLLISYAAANRDERRWSDPDRFDIRRGAQEQLSFGTGIHMCVGMHLAKLEMRCLFTALALRVERIEVGEARRSLHNTLRGLSYLDVRVTGR